MLPTANQKEPGSQAQSIDPTWLAAWLKAIQEQQIKQTKYLRNISTVATIIGLLIIFGFLFGACSAFMSF
jgi:hypothetical protein